MPVRPCPSIGEQTLCRMFVDFGTGIFYKTFVGYASILRKIASVSHTLWGAQRSFYPYFVHLLIDWHERAVRPFTPLNTNCFVRYKRHVTIHSAVQYACIDMFSLSLFFFCKSRSEDETLPIHYYLYLPHDRSSVMIPDITGSSSTTFKTALRQNILSGNCKTTLRFTHWFLERILKSAPLCKVEPRCQILTQTTTTFITLFIIPSRLM
jgi:hypothetical protein